jgi:hypothetical protein
MAALCDPDCWLNAIAVGPGALQSAVRLPAAEWRRVRRGATRSVASRSTEQSSGAGPGTVYELEVLALERSGNQTISVGFFRTD